MSLREEIDKVLRGAGLSGEPHLFDSDIHSWRCREPDRYGHCGCFEELVEDIARAIEKRGVPRRLTDQEMRAGLEEHPQVCPIHLGQVCICNPAP